MNLSLKTSINQIQQLLKGSAVSVYIGHESVEIAHLKKGIKGPSVVKTIRKDIPKEDVTSDTIREIFLKENIKETNVTTTLPEESVMLRRFTMPIIPRQDRQAAVMFEAKRHIPFNIDEVISNYQITREDHIKNQMDVLFVAAKKEDIKNTLSLMEGAGLTVEKIEPVSLALIEAVTLAGGLEKISAPAIAVYFFTKTEAQIGIVENGIPYIRRDVSLANKELSIENQLLNEIKLSLSYYKREFPEKNMAKIIVCGLNEEPAWFGFLNSNLNIPVEQALPLKKMSGIDLPNPQFEISIGLASLNLKKPLIELNLLPKEFAAVKYNFQKIVAVEIIAAISILGLFYFSQIPSIKKLENSVNSEKNKRTVPAELSLKSTEELNALKTACLQKRDILISCAKNTVNWHAKLKRLSELVPNEIWITQMALLDPINAPDTRSLVLKCSVYTEDSVLEIESANNFSAALKNDPVFMNGFKTLTLGAINKTKIGDNEIMNFDISLTTK